MNPCGARPCSKAHERAGLNICSVSEKDATSAVEVARPMVHAIQPVALPGQVGSCLGEANRVAHLVVIPRGHGDQCAVEHLDEGKINNG